MKRPEAFLKLIRPFTLLAPFVGFLCGAVMAARGLPPLASLLGAVAAVILNAASNALNQYFDRDVDRINKPGRPLAQGIISGGEALGFSVILYAAALGLAALVNIRFLVIALLTAGITVLYSAPPVRLKARAFAANAAIAVPRGLLLIVAGWSTVRSLRFAEPWFVGGLFGLYVLGACTTKDFADVEGDQKHGINTLPVKYGPRTAARLICPFLVLPFLLIPVGVALGIVSAYALPLCLLAGWGGGISRLLLKKPEALSCESNHVSWKHMYLLLITGQVGFAVVSVVG